MNTKTTGFLGFIEFNSSNIIDRAKEVLELNSDSDLANLLGVHRATVSGWRKRNSLDVRDLLTKLAGINVHWLVTGEGQPFFDQAKQNLASEPQAQYNAGTLLDDPLGLLAKLQSMQPDKARQIVDLVNLYSKK